MSCDSCIEWGSDGGRGGVEWFLLLSGISRKGSVWGAEYGLFGKIVALSALCHNILVGCLYLEVLFCNEKYIVWSYFVGVECVNFQ